jgi:hypothetical protein
MLRSERLWGDASQCVTVKIKPVLLCQTLIYVYIEKVEYYVHVHVSGYDVAIVRLYVGIIIIIIIIGKDTISFLQGIYTYIPETNNVPKE